MKKIAVMGSGSWGTALSILLNNNGNDVTLWSYKEEEASALRTSRMQPNLKDAIIDEKIKITSDLADAINGKDIILVVVPSKAVRENIESYKEYITKDQVIVTASKGIEEDSLKTMTDIIGEILPDNKLAILSGPSHAEEVARCVPTTCIVACDDKQVAEMLQNVFMSDVFRVYINKDVLGVELGGSLKNIISLAAGIADGLELGDNAKAALITRGLVEISRIGTAMGANLTTFYGLSGLGDLIVTCNSMHSRNRRCGILIGKGLSLDDATKEVGMVVEGINSARSGLSLAKKYNVEAPIIEVVNKVLFENESAKLMVEGLMRRSRKEEFEDYGCECFKK